MLKSVRQTGVWPNAIIKYIQGIAPATVTDLGCPKPPLATDNLSCLSKLECPLCCEILSQPIELPCSVLACAECIIAWLKISGTVLCPCCYSDIPMAPASLRPASDLIISLLHDILVHCTSCGRDMRAGAYVGHQCTRSPTRSEVNMAANVLRHVISNSPLMSVLSRSLQEEELSVLLHFGHIFITLPPLNLFIANHIHASQFSSHNCMCKVTQWALSRDAQN